MEDQKQKNLFDGDQPKGDENEQVEEQGDELTEDGADTEQDDDACEDPDAAAGKGKGKGQGKGKNDAATAAKPATAPKPATGSNSARFKYPFHVRYATEFLDLAGFVDGTEYTGAQVKEILIANGYTEFADMEPAFHRSEATNTIVITIQGSKKGGRHG